MLHIVGTGHHYQFGTGAQFGRDRCSKSDERAFAFMLRILASSVAAEVFAEELNAQALTEVGKDRSVVQALAMELSRDHMFCEPDRQERVSLGIKMENDIRISAFQESLDEDAVQELVVESWRRREQEWLRRLQPLRSRTVIFICGANHIESFVPLAREYGHECQVVHANWRALRE